TSLSSIKAYAELLVDGEAADDKARMEFYHIIQAEAERLSRLIDNILNISRIESGMLKVNKKPVSLNGILKRVMDVAMPQARVEKNKSMARGSGLGLNLTRQIIEAVHRGRMIVKSEEGKGSTFGFTLPIAA